MRLLHYLYELWSSRCTKDALNQLVFPRYPPMHQHFTLLEKLNNLITIWLFCLEC